VSGAVSSLAGLGGGIGQLDRAATPAAITLSESNRRATTNTGAIAVARSITQRAGGKFYFEIESGGGGHTGLATEAKALTESLRSSGAIALNGHGGLYVDGLPVVGVTPAPGVGQMASFAVNLSARRVWVRVAGGAWHPAGDPVSGDGGASFETITGPLFVAAEPGHQIGAAHVARLLHANFVYAAPAGYAAWG
jgi:hypothetical protein